MRTKKFKLGSEYPAEHFIQQSVEAHFIRQGFCLDASTHIDLICWHPATGEKWQIEAKGMTSQPGLDFRTCLGQLVQRMQDGDVHYAIALPNEPKYLAQIEKTSTWAVKQLNIRWILVDADGVVFISGNSN